MKFADVIAFRKIFGNENKKEVLISFLNAILDFEEKHKIWIAAGREIGFSFELAKNSVDIV